MNRVSELFLWVDFIPFENAESTIKVVAARLARAAPVGFYAGVGAEVVAAIPKGSGRHDSLSWTEWFYSIMGGYGEGGSFFWSTGERSWTGVSVGVTGGSIGIAYSATYYQFKEGGDNPETIEDTCLCDALRYLIYTSTMSLPLLKLLRR